jgi:hypothetical protein
MSSQSRTINSCKQALLQEQLLQEGQLQEQLTAGVASMSSHSALLSCPAAYPSQRCCPETSIDL